MIQSSTIHDIAVRVDLGPRSYDIVVTSDRIDRLRSFACERTAASLVLVVTDDNTATLGWMVGEVLAKTIRVEFATVPPGEQQKSLQSASRLYDRLVDLQADRKTLVVAVGGGVIGDLAGFVAATFNRGLPLLMVPTTLLAMVDSAVGGKVGVNHPKGKNLIGAFHQPAGVWIDTAFLKTLPDREYRSGLAEIVKYGVILDAALFAYLEANVDAILVRDPAAVRHMVTRSCQLKASIVEQDEREETGLRALLNYGHTFAHAFETVGGYGSWLHGEAVAAGMVCASRVAERRQLIAPEVTARQLNLLERFRLPTAPRPWPIRELLLAMRSDKKTVAGRLRLVLPRSLGDAALFDSIRDEEVVSVLQSAQTLTPDSTNARTDRS